MKINALSHSISLKDKKTLREHVIAKMLIYVRAPIIFIYLFIFLNSPSSYPKNTSHVQLICSLMLLNLLNQPF